MKESMSIFFFNCSRPRARVVGWLINIILAMLAFPGWAGVGGTAGVDALGEVISVGPVAGVSIVPGISGVPWRAAWLARRVSVIDLLYLAARFAASESADWAPFTPIAVCNIWERGAKGLVTDARLPQLSACGVGLNPR
jgi:hypothetical protein